MEFNQNPPPVPNDTKPLWEAVKDYAATWGINIPPGLSLDMERRNQFGIDKYGTPLQAFNGRDFLQDAYEEALDFTVYLMGMVMEGYPNITETILDDMLVNLAILWEMKELNR